jgi:hypothetical protein
MKDLRWGNGERAKAGARAAGSVDKAVRAARVIGWRVSHDRSKAATAAREARLRELMGLPAARSLLDGEGEAT